MRNRKITNEDLAQMIHKGFIDLRNEIRGEIHDEVETIHIKMDKHIADLRNETDPVKKRIKRIEEYLGNKDSSFHPYSPLEQ